jgi:hypothetical protein
MTNLSTYLGFPLFFPKRLIYTLLMSYYIYKFQIKVLISNSFLYLEMQMILFIGFLIEQSCS